MCVDEWHHCYADGWKGIIVDEAFRHPAKMARGLALKIYAHAFDRGWMERGDTVVDPFGGIAGTGMTAPNGVRWIGVELEQKFVDLAVQNIALLKHRDPGDVTIVQGDSRRLIHVLRDHGLLGRAAAVVSSPPFSSGDSAGPESLGRRTDISAQRMIGANGWGIGGQSSEGNLATMRAGEAPALVVSSPPYAGMEVSPGNAGNAMMSEKWGTGKALTVSRDYGFASGQLGNMKEGAPPVLVVSSPPYAGIATGAGGLNTKPGTDGQQSGRNATAPSQDTDQRYGSSDGQLAVMREGDVAVVVSSPPYEGNVKHDYLMSDDGKTRARDLRRGFTQGQGCFRGSEGYGDTEGQLGREHSETFWQAAGEIVGQCFQLLRPGGVAIWVTKDFVRKGQRVPFGDQWQALCESRGFVLACRHHAMLVERGGTQGGLFGDDKQLQVSRKSFFRRMAESKGSPAIDWEDVICVQKPLS